MTNQPTKNWAITIDGVMAYRVENLMKAIHLLPGTSDQCAVQIIRSMAEHHLPYALYRFGTVLRVDTYPNRSIHLFRFKGLFSIPSGPLPSSELSPVQIEFKEVSFEDLEACIILYLNLGPTSWTIDRESLGSYPGLMRVDYVNTHG
jgi:hypothetical protein